MFEFWLKNETKSEDILLPVTPEGYEISTGMEIETVRATNLGDINVAGRRKPKSITISSFFRQEIIRLSEKAASCWEMLRNM